MPVFVARKWSHRVPVFGPISRSKLEPVKVEHYAFGSITVDGVTYERDLIVTPDGVVPDWWRAQGHRLVMDDLRGIDFFGVRRIVVGTGYFGRVSVDESVRSHFENAGIDLTTVDSRRAVEAFNEAGDGAVLAIHLTC